MFVPIVNVTLPDDCRNLLGELSSPHVVSARLEFAGRLPSAAVGGEVTWFTLG